MTNEENINYCYRHKNKETKLSCNECGKYICPACVIQAPVGFKCPDCVKGKVSHLEKLTPNQYAIAIILSLIVSCIGGYIWHKVAFWGYFGELLLSYLIGFSVTKSVCSIIGYKTGFRIQAIISISITIGLIYNPLKIILTVLDKGINTEIIMNSIVLPLSYFTPILIVSLAIAIWASIRHTK